MSTNPETRRNRATLPAIALEWTETDHDPGCVCYDCLEALEGERAAWEELNESQRP